MSVDGQEWSARDHVIYHQLWTVAAAVGVGAIALPFVAAGLGLSFDALMTPATGGLAVWTVWVVAQSRRTGSRQRVRVLELRHMLVWAIAVVAYLLAGFTAMLVSGDVPGSAWWWWAFVGVMPVGWVALHARITQLPTDR